MQTHYVKNVAQSSIRSRLSLNSLHNSRLYINPGPYHLPCSAHEKLFMDNLEDYRFLMSAAGKKAIIDLHVNGICNYLKSFE